MFGFFPRDKLYFPSHIFLFLWYISCCIWPYYSSIPFFSCNNLWAIVRGLTYTCGKGEGDTSSGPSGHVDPKREDDGIVHVMCRGK